MQSLLVEVLVQLEDWYGNSVHARRHLKTYEIEYALPQLSPRALAPVEKQAIVRTGVFICGDHCDTASINGAMASGRRAAAATLSYLEER